MAKILDENRELERRLSVIVATATGEQEYVAADTGIDGIMKKRIHCLQDHRGKPD